MDPERATVDKIITQLGVKDDATAQHLHSIFREVHGGPLGGKAQGALCLRDKGEIQFLTFEKISPTQVSVAMYEPKIPQKDQRAIIAYLGDATVSANEIYTLVRQAADLRSGKAEGFLLLTDDGTTPTEMRFERGKVVFRKIDALAPPWAR